METGESLEYCLYKFLRCTITHEAGLDHRITLTLDPVFGATANGLLISKRHLEGLILAVLCSPVNHKEQCTDLSKCSFIQGNVSINDLWGNEPLVRQKLNLLSNTWN